MPVNARANELLADIGRLDRVLAEHEAEFRAKVEDLEQTYQSLLQPLRDRRQGAHEELIGLMKRHKEDLFAEGPRVALERGVLVHEQGKRVVIPRNALALAEEQGLKEAVKVAKSIDRGVVEAWPDERLALIGAARKAIHTYSYEVT